MKVKEELAFDYCGETNFDVTEAVPAFIAGFDTAKEILSEYIDQHPSSHGDLEFLFAELYNKMIALGDEEVKE